jgi:hypothetical protein
MPGQVIAGAARAALQDPLREELADPGKLSQLGQRLLLRQRAQVRPVEHSGPILRLAQGNRGAAVVAPLDRERHPVTSPRTARAGCASIRSSYVPL